MKECEVANIHGQASDAYAYVWMVQSSLFSWKTSWLLSHPMKKGQVANFHGQAATLHLFNVWHRFQSVIHENKLPCTIQT
jgi:hypothetical protein